MFRIVHPDGKITVHSASEAHWITNEYKALGHKIIRCEFTFTVWPLEG